MGGFVLSPPSPDLEEMLEGLHIFCSQEATHQFAQLSPQNHATPAIVSLAKGCPTFSLDSHEPVSEHWDHCRLCCRKSEHLHGRLISRNSRKDESLAHA